jgi:hypothetical protein
MKSRAHRRRAVLLTLCLLVGVIVAGGVSLWLRARQRQYALNRQLIAALVKGDDKQALTARTPCKCQRTGSESHISIALCHFIMPEYGYCRSTVGPWSQP